MGRRSDAAEAAMVTALAWLTTTESLEDTRKRDRLSHTALEHA
jgi:hypothetical protein